MLLLMIVVMMLSQGMITQLIVTSILSRLHNGSLCNLDTILCKIFYDFLVLINWLCAARQNINIMTNISKLKQSLLILAFIRGQGRN